ncbi:hypothetical protein [Bradyrhizobium stylosanthis]|uniref:hypothetical protein n=1 Tax=Bradyrhizobium stylosanthis TaxID=1803665 RepID=UPI0011A42A2D|nr:hypothetical protein [Bradyrhizobium stylosanthis]
MAKATAQARDAHPAAARRAVDGARTNAARNHHVVPGISARSACGAMFEWALVRTSEDQSNWRMDQCAIHMDRAETMLWQTPCPILPQPAE